MSNPEKERVCYNAANVALQTDWDRLAKLKSQNGGWETAWHKIQPGFPALEPAEEWHKIAESGVRLILREDKEYPFLLSETSSPPFGIYLRGTLPPAESIAIVGTRKATEEGRGTASFFASRLAESGLGIVSGLALGIDAAAHEGALRAGGKTWAVLANGPDRIYPSLHAKLGAKILESGGGILSEYPPGSPPLPYRFLARNRIVSGLTRGTLVVEAPKNSGALVTARFALDQNRELFVIPGPVAHPNFRGSHYLVRAGAELVTCPEDIFTSLGVPEKKDAAADLSPEEKLLFDLIVQVKEPVNIDKLIELTNLETQTANQALGFLVIKGKIKETGRGYELNG